MFCLCAPDLGRVYQSSFDDQSTKRVCDENYGSLGGLSNPPICCEFGNEMLGMVVYLVLRCAIGERGDIRIVTVDQNPGLLFFEYWREQLGRPEDVALFGCPCVVWIPVQTMDKDYINSGWPRRGDFGKTKAVDHWDL